MFLTNPYLGEQNVSRVMADLPDSVFNYFFNPDGPGALTHVRGARQALIAQFFQKLYEECISEGIPPRWEPETESRIQGMMDRLVFNEQYSDE